MGIFVFYELLRSTASEIATPACALVRKDAFSCHSEAVTDVTAVGIFVFDELLRSTTPEIATPACALVRNDKERRVRRWFAMTLFLVIPRQ